MKPRTHRAKKSIVGFWKGLSHAWDTVLSPDGDVEGPFRGGYKGTRVDRGI